MQVLSAIQIGQALNNRICPRAKSLWFAKHRLISLKKPHHSVGDKHESKTALGVFPSIVLKTLETSMHRDDSSFLANHTFITLSLDRLCLRLYLKKSYILASSTVRGLDLQNGFFIFFPLKNRIWLGGGGFLFARPDTEGLLTLPLPSFHTYFFVSGLWFIRCTLTSKWPSIDTINVVILT